MRQAHGGFNIAEPSVFRFRLGSGAHLLALGNVAIAAVGLVEIVADINRMHEISNTGPRRDIFLFLADDGMAQVAIL